MKLRELLLLSIVLTLIACLAILAGSMASQMDEEEIITAPEPVVEKVIHPPLPENVESHVNQYRGTQGKPAINSEVPILDQAAQARAEQMCSSNEWSHDNAWTVLDQYYTYASASENLYYGSLRENHAESIVATWRDSPGHQENMVKDHVEMGMGVKHCPGFQDDPTAVIVVNYFGVPR